MARHHAVIDRKLMDLACGRIKRLIIQMPPRHGKSELCAKYFPAWYMGKYPDRNFMMTSAVHALAHKWSAESRDLIQEHGYEGSGLFNAALHPKDRGAGDWRTSSNGEFRAIGVGGSAFGFGFNIGWVDDYHGSMADALSAAERDNVHRWYHGTIRNRVNDENLSGIGISATRYHKDDLVGRLLKEQEHGGDQWEVVSFPGIAREFDILGRQPGEALWPEKWSLKHLDKERRSLIASGYPWMWDALYDCEPSDITDTEFPAAYFENIGFDEWPVEVTAKAIAIDPSMGKTNKSDFSAILMCAMDHQGRYFIDADLARRPGPQIVRDAIQWHKRFKPHALGCETNGFQDLLGDEFFRVAAQEREPIDFMGIPNNTDKKIRIRSLSPFLHDKRLFFKNNSPGVSILLEQLRMFPAGKYDDGPDALEMVLRLIQRLLRPNSSNQLEAIRL